VANKPYILLHFPSIFFSNKIGYLITKPSYNLVIRIKQGHHDTTEHDIKQAFHQSMET